MVDTGKEMTKILVVEDEKDIRELISFTLDYGGFKVVAVSNGEDALVKAKEELPDLILLDVRMPRMSGYEVCAELKKHKKTRNIPVAFLSAKGQEAEIEQGIEMGAVEYIVKPFAPEKLLRQIRDILSRTSSS